MKEHGESLLPKHAKDFFVNVVGTNPSNPQQMRGECMCCGTSVSTTGSTRFATHLKTCSLTPEAVRKQFGALRCETEQKASAKREALAVAREEGELIAQELRAQQAEACRGLIEAICS